VHSLLKKANIQHIYSSLLQIKALSIEKVWEEGICTYSAYKRILKII